MSMQNDYTYLYEVFGTGSRIAEKIGMRTPHFTRSKKTQPRQFCVIVRLLAESERLKAAIRGIARLCPGEVADACQRVGLDMSELNPGMSGQTQATVTPQLSSADATASDLVSPR